MADRQPSLLFSSADRPICFAVTSLDERPAFRSTHDDRRSPSQSQYPLYHAMYPISSRLTA